MWEQGNMGFPRGNGFSPGFLRQRDGREVHEARVMMTRWVIAQIRRHSISDLCREARRPLSWHNPELLYTDYTHLSPPPTDPEVSQTLASNTTNTNSAVCQSPTGIRNSPTTRTERTVRTVRTVHGKRADWTGAFVCNNVIQEKSNGITTTTTITTITTYTTDPRGPRAPRAPRGLPLPPLPPLPFPQLHPPPLLPQCIVAFAAAAAGAAAVATAAAAAAGAGAGAECVSMDMGMDGQLSKLSGLVEYSAV
jgi:hypothetical protein